MRIYVGNLPFDFSDTQLKDTFAIHGTVESAQIIIDRDTNRSKGFGFVEMPAVTEANAAIQTLNGKDVNGRGLTVNEARPREARTGGGSSRTGSGSYGRSF